MRKTILQFSLLFVSIVYLPSSLFCQYQEYVVKQVTTEHDDPKKAKLIELALDGINKDPRIHVVKQSETTDKPVSHLIEGVSSYSIQGKEFSSGKFVDSTKTAAFKQNFEYSSRVQLLITSVETGQVENVIYFSVNDKKSYTYKTNYSKIGYSPSIKKDKTKMGKVTVAAKKTFAPSRKKSEGKLWNVVQNSIKSKASAYGGRALFPYRFEVTKIVKAKKDKAKIVTIEHDERFAKFSETKGVLYTIENKEVDGDKIEEFKILGSGSMAKKGGTATSFNCKVSRSSSERKVNTAISENKKVYFSFGNKPYTKKSSKEIINIAVADINFPKSFTDKTINSLYTKLKFELYYRPGFSVLERNKFENILAEKEEQKSEQYMDKDIISQFNSTGADYILEYVFTQSPSVKKSTSKSFMPGEEDYQEYLSSFHFSARLYEVSTGEMVHEEQLYSEPKFKLKKTERPKSTWMQNKAALMMGFQSGTFLNNALPPKIVCYEILEVKKGEAKKVLLYGDVAHAKKDKFEVIRKTTVEVNGKKLERFSVIGKLSLNRQKGDGLIEAKVKSGGDVILQAMENGEQLLCTDKPNWIERWSNSVDKRRKRYGY